MSSGVPPAMGGRPRNVSMQFMLAMLVGIGLVLYIVYNFGSSSDSLFMQNRSPSSRPSEPKASTPPSGQPSPSTEADPKAAERAVADVRMAQAREKIAQARTQLQRLKQQHAIWQSRSATILGGDPGRRIAGSDKHLNLAVELFERVPTNDTGLVSWEQQLSVLAAPLDSGQAHLELSPEFLRALDDLGRQMTDASTQIERRLQLIEALTQETGSLPPAPLTLEETLRNRQASTIRAEAERLATVREKARREAEEENAKRIEASERELVAAEAKRQEEKLRAEKERIEQLTAAEKTLAAEEAKLRAVEQRAIQEGLKAEATRVEAAIKEAQLEREFQRDLPDVKSYLSPFISEGYGRRKSGKGPMSLGYLKGKGALAESQDGINNLQLQATGTNDRPLGAFPGGFSTNDVPGINKAAELLRKYGDLLVKKGMLDE